MKLHRKFLKVPGEKAAQFVECIDHMHADGTSESLLQYTREWVERVNRGGLFDVSDEAYSLFVVIELTMRRKLTERLKCATVSEEGKSTIFNFVCENTDVQFHWSLLSTDISSEEESMELLRYIVNLWLNIRGFSISKAWIEEYKCALKDTTAKKKSLRKELKKTEQAAKKKLSL